MFERVKEEGQVVFNCYVETLRKHMFMVNQSSFDDSS